MIDAATDTNSRNATEPTTEVISLRAALTVLGHLPFAIAPMDVRIGGDPMAPKLG